MVNNGYARIARLDDELCSLDNNYLVALMDWYCEWHCWIEAVSSIDEVVIGKFDVFVNQKILLIWQNQYNP